MLARPMILWPALGLAALLAGCTTGPLARDTRYRCDNGMRLSVHAAESATLQGYRGAELLLRDAGGVGPEQAVFSNPQVRVQTGFGADGREAKIQGQIPGGQARCVREGGLF